MEREALLVEETTLLILTFFRLDYSLVFKYIFEQIGLEYMRCHYHQGHGTDVRQPVLGATRM